MWNKFFVFVCCVLCLIIRRRIKLYSFNSARKEKIRLKYPLRRNKTPPYSTNAPNIIMTIRSSEILMALRITARAISTTSGMIKAYKIALVSIDLSAMIETLSPTLIPIGKSVMVIVWSLESNEVHAPLAWQLLHAELRVISTSRLPCEMDLTMPTLHSIFNQTAKSLFAWLWVFSDKGKSTHRCSDAKIPKLNEFVSFLKLLFTWRHLYFYIVLTQIGH